MKRLRSVLCALALALAISPTTFAGDIHGVTVNGNIHGVTATRNPSDINEFLTYLAGWVVGSIAGNIHG